MKFGYKKIGPGKERPIIPIEVRNPKTSRSIKYYALVDSGADMNLFDRTIGDIIGIDVESGTQMQVGGVVAGQLRTYYEHDVELVVGGWVFSARVGFMDDLASNGNGLVGQQGFFDKFKFVKFEAVKGIVELGSLVM